MEIKILNEKVKDYGLPQFETSGAAAIDLRAIIEEPICIQPGETVLIPTGIAIWIGTPRLVGLIAPRSGLGHKSGLVLGNGIGVIDSDYQGEIKVSAFNRNHARTKAETLERSVCIHPGDRIAQMLFTYVDRPVFNIVKVFTNESERGEGGFGSTGTK